MAELSQFTSGENAARIRTAALEAIKDIPGAVLGDGEINEIIRQTASEHLSVAELTTRAAGLAAEIAKSHGAKPINDLHATPDEIDRMRATQGLPPLIRGAHLFARGGDEKESGGDRQSGSAAYARGLTNSTDPAFLRSVGLNDATGKALAAMGFTTPEQVRQIVNDANTLGLAPKSAALDLGRLRKAEGPRTDAHVAALKQYGDGLRALDAEKREIDKIQDPAVRAERMREHEEKRRAEEEKANSYRDRNVQTPEGKKSFDSLRDKLREQYGKRAELKAKQDPTVTGAHQDRVNEVRELGATQQVEAQHQTMAEKLEKNPGSIVRTDNDLVAGFLNEPGPPDSPQVPQKQAGPAAPAADAKPAQTAPDVKAAKKADEPKTQPRQAVHSKALNPTV